VIEQALETAALMLGSDKSRGYCLEMICADFLAGANLNDGDPDVLLHALSRSFDFLPASQRQFFKASVSRSNETVLMEKATVRLHGKHYCELREEVLQRDGWRCQLCGSVMNLTVHHQRYRSRSGEDLEQNLITLCSECHAALHRRVS